MAITVCTKPSLLVVCKCCRIALHRLPVRRITDGYLDQVLGAVAAGVA